MNTARRVEAKRGVQYLFVIGVAGLLLAGWVMATGLLDIVSRQPNLRAGFGSLVIGVAFGAAASRVLGMRRQARLALRRE